MRFVFALLCLSLNAFAGAPMPLQYSPDCILDAVLRYKHLARNPEIRVAPVFLESTTPLKQFQDAIEPQWHMRPDVFTNAYIVAKNEIYLIDDSKYYLSHGRTVDDSLAHELAHYVQVMYKHFDLDTGDDSLESDAVDVQTWFREEFMQKGQSPCAR